MQAQASQQELYENLILPESFLSITIGGTTFTVGEPIKLDQILQILNQGLVPYHVIEDYRFPFWGGIWLKELGIVCHINAKGEGTHVDSGLSVGMSVSDVYELFDQTGPASVDALSFSTRTTHSFLGNQSVLGFLNSITVFFVGGRVLSFQIQFSEVSP